MRKNELREFWFTEKIYEALKQGLVEVQKLVPGYDPVKPHLSASARPDASTFFEEFDSIEKVFELAKNCRCSVESNDSAIIFEIRCQDDNGDWRNIGKAKQSKPSGDGPWIVVAADHGLVAMGDAEESEEPTYKMTAVFTKEGEDFYVLATLHPGDAETPGDYTNCKVGDLLTRQDLNNRHIGRVIHGAIPKH